MTELGERIDARGEQLLEFGERFVKLAERGLEQSRRSPSGPRRWPRAAARWRRRCPPSSAPSGLAEPLEGVVERMGKLADRLPGGARPQPPPDPDTRALDS